MPVGFIKQILLLVEMEIINEQAIINTYNKWQQEQCRLYYKYKRIKQENPSFGYKKISRLLGQPSAKTRWWNCGKYTPVPIQTVNWLKEKGLVPLTDDNLRLFLITKLIGTMFGDGGIFGNLNGIFLSSSELEAVKEFGTDLKRLFGSIIEENFRIIEGGVYGHSWCYQNTNRNVIRFFVALGAPVGDKSQTKLVTPGWINKCEERVADEFFGSLFGNEINIPKVHKNKNNLDTFSIGLTGKEGLCLNRIEFLNSIGSYLNNKSIITGKISINDHHKCNRKGEPTKIYRLLISTKFENVVNFMTLTKINYCRYKQEKLANTMNEFSEIKRCKLHNLISKGYKESTALNLLNLTSASLEIISNFEDFNKIYDKENETIPA